MTSVLFVRHGPGAGSVLRSDLDAAGLDVRAELPDCRNLVQEAARHAPDVVVVDAPLPDEALFASLEKLTASIPCAVLVFSGDAAIGNIERAVQAGVHTYVVQRYAAQHLNALIALARARQQRERSLREQLQEVTQRLEDRKAVERAKGILMRAREVSDEDAFQMLRNASMHANLRLGQVSQHIIQSAHFADALNRAGQLRMLSQRAVKLHLLRLAEPRDPAHKSPLDDSVQRVDANLVWLGKSPSAEQASSVLQRLSATWSPLKAALQARPSSAHLADVNALAETLLTDAEQLTASLEAAGHLPSLRVLNVAGRQRMLSQRFAKLALMQLLGLDGDTAGGGGERLAVQQEFERAQVYLNALPLSTAEIRETLEAAGVRWQQMLTLVPGGRRPAGRDLSVHLGVVAQNSEVLLADFEQLSTCYERSMQMLMG